MVSKHQAEGFVFAVKLYRELTLAPLREAKNVVLALLVGAGIHYDFDTLGWSGRPE